MNSIAMVTKRPKLVYCFIPKNACTYLKRFIRFVSGDYNNTADINTLEDIPRIYTHFGPMKSAQKLHLSHPKIVKQLNRAGYKFMMSRDPYTRLWSGYLDKLYLPEFWHMHGKIIMNKIRLNPDPYSLRCGHNVTFEEFLTYVAFNLERGNKLDMHFHQSYIRCNPCEMKFNLIGKLESFTNDFDLMLNDTKLTSRIKTGRDSNRDRALEEMKTLTAYNFDVGNIWDRKAIHNPCAVPVEVAERLWHAFQVNGYIGDDTIFPAQEVYSINTRPGVRDYLLETFTAMRNSASDEEKNVWKRQRIFYLKKAYMKVPLIIRERIRDVFTLDFEIFDYNPEPEYVFPADYVSNYNNTVVTWPWKKKKPKPQQKNEKT